MTIWEQLAEPFDPSEVKFKPGATSGNRALALAYVDARVIQDRLDDVCGPGGWCDKYTLWESGVVRCRLSICPGEGLPWITKEDVGGESEQKDAGDRAKAAVSDALKRAAVKFKIGRYLYRLPQVWADYDPQKKQFVKTPALPEWALPGKKTPPAVIVTPDKAVYAAVAELDPATPLLDCPVAWSVVTLRAGLLGLSMKTLAERIGYKHPKDIPVSEFSSIMERFDRATQSKKTVK